MQEYNIITLLNSFGVEVVITAVFSFLVAILLKHLFKLGNKQCLLISFVLSLLINLFIELVFYKLEFGLALQKGITAGAISIILTSFAKKIAFTNKKDIKKDLEKLLSTIVLSDELDKVVDDIIERIKANTVINEDSVKSVIKENLSNQVDDEKLELIAKFILNALNIKDN